MNFKLSKTHQVYFVAVFISLFLSVLTIYHYPVFNIDGLLYFKAANVFLAHGLKASMDIYAWPLFPVLLAYISKVFHLSLLQAAYLLNFIFSTLIVLMFIKLVQELGVSTRLLWLAALVILVYIDFNHYRSDVLRDHGYWFFYLFSIFSFLRFTQTFKWSDAILWGLSILIATLFRIEGGIFFLLAPFIIFLFKDISFFQQLKSYIKLNILLIALVLIMLAFFITHLSSSYHSEKLSGSIYNISSGLTVIINQLNDMYVHTKQYIIGPLAINDAANFVFFGLLGLYLYTIISLISLGYLIPAIYAQFNNMMPNQTNKRFVLFWYILINLIVTSAFFLQNQGFLSDRYLIPLALTLMLFVPFGLNYLYQHWRKHSQQLNIHNLLFWFVCLTIVWMAVGSLWRFGPSKVYIYKSAQWIRKNTPADAKVYTNHAVLGTLVERQSGGYDPAQADYFTTQKIAQKPWTGYNYAIFVMTSDDQKYIVQIEQTMEQLPIEAYYDNHHRDQAYIFQFKKRHPAT